jgi:hypothetical protein
MDKKANVQEESQLSKIESGTESDLRSPIHNNEQEESKDVDPTEVVDGVLSDQQRDFVAKVKEVTNSIKKPIFIASAEPDIVDKIEQFLVKGYTYADKPVSELPVLDPEKYAVFMLQADIFQKLNQNYLFGLLGKDEQEREKQVMLDERMKQTAAQQAIQVEEFILAQRVNNGLYTEHNIKYAYEFNEPELKTIIAKCGKNLSHKMTWTLMDFLLLHGFLVPLSADNKIPKEKRRYRLTLTDDVRLDKLRDLIYQSCSQEEYYKSNTEDLKKKAEELESKIAKDNEQRLAEQDAAKQSAIDSSTNNTTESFEQQGALSQTKDTDTTERSDS